MNQKGFATLEVILMVVIIGILATVAVPRFTDMTMKANTAKIQADLSTLDNAIEIYYMDKGEYPDDISDLGDYVKDVGNLKPPTGKAFTKDSSGEITISDSDNYEITTSNSQTRATLSGKTSGDFSIKKGS